MAMSSARWQATWMQDLETALGAFTVNRAARHEVGHIVRLLTDDVLGAGREGAPDSVYEAAFDEINADPHQYLAVVKDVTGQIVGKFQLTLIPGLSRGAAKRLQIEAVRVAPSTRGEGLGRAVFAWAHDYGRRHGATLSQLTTDVQRGDAHRFYEQMGYRPTHRGYKLGL